MPGPVAQGDFRQTGEHWQAGMPGPAPQGRPWQPGPYQTGEVWQPGRGPQNHPPGQPLNGRNPQHLDLTGAGWRFAADVGWRAANTVSTSTPVDFTSGGLPRRSAGQNLVPGSVAGGAPGGPRPDRAEELRGRLGSFQMGLSRGRRSLAERGSANGFPENNPQETE